MARYHAIKILVGGLLAAAAMCAATIVPAVWRDIRWSDQGAPAAAARGPLSMTLRSLPARNDGPGGRPGDPLNIVFVGSEEAIQRALAASGWKKMPDSLSGSIAGGLRELAAGLNLSSFPPVSVYRLFGRPQDMSFSIPTFSIFSRHHFRLWRTGRADEGGRPVWWGSANYDISIRWSDLTHRPDPDMNRERDFIASTLSRAAQLSWVELPRIPRVGLNDNDYPFLDDGRILVAIFN